MTTEYKFKLRLKQKNGSSIYRFATDEADCERLQTFYEASEEVVSVIVYPIIELVPATHDDVRESKAYHKELNKHSNPFVRTAQAVSAGLFFSKPYTIDQIDIRDKVQISNFARQILVDPADSLFPPIQEQTDEQLLACVEFHKAQFDLAMEFAKRANLVAGSKRVEAIRGEGEKFKKAKRAKTEAVYVSGKTSQEKEKLAKKNASLHGTDTEHKNLLKFVSIMGLNIENYSTLSKDELKAKIALLKNEMMGNKGESK